MARYFVDEQVHRMMHDLRHYAYVAEEYQDYDPEYSQEQEEYLQEVRQDLADYWGVDADEARHFISRYWEEQGRWPEAWYDLGLCVRAS